VVVYCTSICGSMGTVYVHDVRQNIPATRSTVEGLLSFAHVGSRYLNVNFSNSYCLLGFPGVAVLTCNSDTFSGCSRHNRNGTCKNVQLHVNHLR